MTKLRFLLAMFIARSYVYKLNDRGHRYPIPSIPPIGVPIVRAPRLLVEHCFAIAGTAASVTYEICPLRYFPPAYRNDPHEPLGTLPPSATVEISHVISRPTRG